MKNNELKEYNQEELLKAMEELASQGFSVFVKWTCKKCSERVICDTPNAFYTKGFLHTEKEDGSICNYTSFPDKFGLMVEKAIGLQ